VPAVFICKDQIKMMDTVLELMEELDNETPPETFKRISQPGGHLPFSKSAASRHRQPRQREAQEKVTAKVAQFVLTQDDSLKSFDFTYHASLHEQGWLLASLGAFYEQNWITDILRLIKGGKEASVYLCASGQSVREPTLAAKVFRPRNLRNLKNDQLYRAGRDVLDEDGNHVRDLGMLKAQHKRSIYGEQIRHQSWIAYEFQTLKTLHAAEADVPHPYEMGSNAILMGYIGDAGTFAPTLNTIRLDKSKVKPLFERLLSNIDIMLAHDIVHGDLSAYNILYWEGTITLIDFPQVISARKHPSAYAIFCRDIKRVCEYFNRQGLRTDPTRLAADLWQSHGYRPVPEIHPSLLDADDEHDRMLWKEQ
jgi:RIO kinase 1